VPSGGGAANGCRRYVVKRMIAQNGGEKSGVSFAVRAEWARRASENLLMLRSRNVNVTNIMN
jgi:hypothetical protein